MFLGPCGKWLTRLCHMWGLGNLTYFPKPTHISDSMMQELKRHWSESKRWWPNMFICQRVFLFLFLGGLVSLPSLWEMWEEFKGGTRCVHVLKLKGSAEGQSVPTERQSRQQILCLLSRLLLSLQETEEVFSHWPNGQKKEVTFPQLTQESLIKGHLLELL